MNGERLIAGRYRLEYQIGSGGMGVVWLATDTELDRPVALKRAREPGNPHELKRMRREARNIGKLPHEHAVTLHDLVVDDDHAWLVMEYVPSSSLAELIAKEPLIPQRAARIGAQLAEALAEAHRSGLVHHDVKPGNVLFSRLATGDAPDHVKLTDFGIARRDGDATLTDGGGSGTPAFMSPEVAGDEPATPASDVFSLGSTLYAAVSGSPPFGTDGNPNMIKTRVRAGEVEIARGAGPLGPVLRKLLARNPADRPTAKRAAELLRAAADAPPAPGDELRNHLRWRLVAGGGAAAVLLAVVVAVIVVVARVGPASARSPDRTTDPAPSAQPPASATAGLGELRSADPCALTDPTALHGFGQAARETDYGDFARCDVIVTPAPGNSVDVKVEFFGPPDAGEPPPDTVEDVGVGHLARGADDGQECERQIQLPDGNQVDITAGQQRTGEANRCGMAEAAAQSAIAVLRRGPVPRRTASFAPASLARLDACALPGATAIARVPGLDPTTPDPGFAGWSCRWSGGAQGYGALVEFDHNQPYTAENGTRIRVSGRDAVVAPGGYSDDGCAVRIVYRAYRDGRGDPLNEVVIVEVSGRPPPGQLCGPAAELATAVAAALPAG